MCIFKVFYSSYLLEGFMGQTLTSKNNTRATKTTRLSPLIERQMNSDSWLSCSAANAHLSSFRLVYLIFQGSDLDQVPVRHHSRDCQSIFRRASTSTYVDLNNMCGSHRNEHPACNLTNMLVCISTSQSISMPNSQLGLPSGLWWYRVMGLIAHSNTTSHLSWITERNNYV